MEPPFKTKLNKPNTSCRRKRGRWTPRPNTLSPLRSPPPSPPPLRSCSMPKNLKRKHPTLALPPSTPLKPPSEPYPDIAGPTPEQCLAVRDSLLDHHGFPLEFVKYRRSPPSANPAPSVALSETVLDGLVSTLLSQNTTEINSRRAFESLKSAFPIWDQVLDAQPELIEDAIRCGGLAATKTARIKSILMSVRERRGEICLEYLRDLPVEEVKAELMQFKGIGPKTVACVLMFQLQRDDFPVDTHVFRITKAIGWIPAKADREKAYLHLNKRIPDELKFDLNCLLVTHGKLCPRCASKGGKQPTDKAKRGGKKTGDGHSTCPLISYSCSEDKHDS